MEYRELEAADCLWSVIVLAHKCGIDRPAEFAINIRQVTESVSRERRITNCTLHPPKR